MRALPESCRQLYVMKGCVKLERDQWHCGAEKEINGERETMAMTQKQRSGAEMSYKPAS